jgi:mgtE-like transporter
VLKGKRKRKAFIISPEGILKKKSEDLDQIIRKTGVIQILIQTMPLLALSIFGELFAGLTLEFIITEILLIPGLIILVPAISDLRGDVGTTLGSRLSVLLYEGRLERLKILLWNNVGSSIVLSVFVSLPIGIMAYLFSILLGLPSVSLLYLLMIALLSTLVASIFLSTFTVITTLVSFRRGIDPDNVVAPSLATISDIVTTLTILFAAKLVTAYFELCLVFVEASSVVLAIVFLILEFSTRKTSKNHLVRPNEKPRRIVLEGIPSLFLSAIIGVASGSILHMNAESLALTPTLVTLIPLIVANAGILGSILGARLSSALQLGEIEAFKPSSLFLKNIFAIFILGNVSSLLIGFLVFAAFKILNIPVLDLGTMLVFNFQVCFVVTVAMVIFTTFIAFESFRRGLNPSNIVIPIITSLGDILGVLSLIGIASIYGFV